MNFNFMASRCYKTMQHHNLCATVFPSKSNVLVKRTAIIPSRLYEYEPKLMKIDGMSNHHQLIYRMENERFWRYGTCFSSYVLVLSPVLFGFLYCERKGLISPSNEEDLFQIFIEPIAISDSEFYPIALGLFVGSILTQYMITRFPLRIYYDGKSQYTAILAHLWNPRKYRRFQFTTARQMSRYRFLGKTRFLLGSRSCRLYVDNFRTSSDLFEMCQTTNIESSEEVM